jgi:hypothetical protein
MTSVDGSFIGLAPLLEGKGKPPCARHGLFEAVEVEVCILCWCLRNGKG